MVALGFIPIVIVVVIIVIIMVIAARPIEGKRGGEDMIKNVYVYLVLFATLMMVIGGGVGVFMATADIIFPAPYYQSFEDYRQMSIRMAERPDGAMIQETQSNEELMEMYTATVDMQREKQVNRAKNALVKSFGWIVIPLPIFIYFKRNIVNKEDKAIL